MHAGQAVGKMVTLELWTPSQMHSGHAEGIEAMPFGGVSRFANSSDKKSGTAFFGENLGGF